MKLQTGSWESINNPNFNYGEFATIKSQAGLNNYKISVKEWVNNTTAIGLRATTGRYGGTYAHRDIAFEFGSIQEAMYERMNNQGLLAGIMNCMLLQGQIQRGKNYELPEETGNSILN